VISSLDFLTITFPKSIDVDCKKQVLQLTTGIFWGCFICADQRPVLQVRQNAFATTLVSVANF
jgi:hypothetical protein